MRRAVLAAAVVLASGCCVDVAEDDACVVPGYPRAYCQPMPHDELVCWADVDPAPPLSRDRRTCAGELHEDHDCDELGYTVSCDRGTYFVRAGDDC